MEGIQCSQVDCDWISNYLPPTHKIPAPQNLVLLPKNSAVPEEIVPYFCYCNCVRKVSREISRRHLNAVKEGGDCIPSTHIRPMLSSLSWIHICKKYSTNVLTQPYWTSTVHLCICAFVHFLVYWRSFELRWLDFKLFSVIVHIWGYWNYFRYVKDAKAHLSWRELDRSVFGPQRRIWIVLRVQTHIWIEEGLFWVVLKAQRYFKIIF